MGAGEVPRWEKKEREERGQKRLGPDPGLAVGGGRSKFNSSRTIKGSRDLGSESFIFEGWVGVMVIPLGLGDAIITNSTHMQIQVEKVSGFADAGLLNVEPVRCSCCNFAVVS